MNDKFELAYMSYDERFIYLANVAGYKNVRYDWINGSDAIRDWLHGEHVRGIPMYLDSYDAIIPLINKLNNVYGEAFGLKFCQRLMMVKYYKDNVSLVFEFSPGQLANCVIGALMEIKA